MSQQLTKTATVLLGLLATTALSPASAQTTPSASPPAAAPPSPAGSASPSSPPTGIVVFADQSTKPPATSESASETSKATDGSSSKATDRAAFFEAHLAALHAGLTLTPDQEKLWPALEQSFRMIAAMKSGDQSGGKAVLDPEADTGPAVAESNEMDTIDPFEALKAAGALLLERGKALESLADAAKPLYSTLTPDQKRRLPILVRSFAPNNMKLRQFLALMTWDAEVNKLQGMEQQSKVRRSERGDRAQGWSRDDQRDDSAMQPNEHRRWHGRHQSDDAEDGGPDRRFGGSDTRSGYEMPQQPGYGYNGDQSDE